MFSFLNKNTIQTYNKKVRTLFTIYTICIMLVLSTLTIITTVFISKTRGQNSLKSSVNEYSLSVNEWFSNNMTTVDTAANMLSFSKFANNSEITDVLNSLSSNSVNKSISSIYLTYDNKQMLEASDKKYAGSSEYTATDWYAEAIRNEGKVVASKPFIKGDKKYITFSKAFIINKAKCVLAYDVLMDELDKLTQDSKDGKEYFFLVSSDNAIICHPNKDITISGENSKLDKVLDGDYKNLFSLTSQNSSDFTSVGDYDSTSKLAYVSHLNGSDWAVVGVTPFTDVYFVLIITIIIQLVALAVNIILLNTIFSDKISKWFLPLLSISNKVDCLATGDLSVTFDENIVSSEIEILATALNKTTQNLNLYISDIKDVLKNLSDCKLSVETTDCYEGDFNDIKESLDSIISNLNGVFTEINDTALGVSYNAEHMQASSQELAAGVTEQSEYIKDMFNSIEKLSVLIKTTANNSVKASEMADKSSTLLATENEDMGDLLQSMDAIKESSKQIGAIINTINEIADQTDLLALNASIEASRAGEAGKSFAVIAGEVGSLARDSAEAVNTITELITNSTKAVNKGVEIANKTADHLAEAVAYSNESKQMIDEISNAAKNQSNEITKINSHVSQISGVTENNQAAAQENFAISDEASNQAQLLKSMVDKFDFE